MKTNVIIKDNKMSGLPSPHSYPQPEPDIDDPLSDLNLFLSHKLKGEIEKNGGVSKWSGAIEANLLAKILPELKQKFPKYNLGASVLKKIWEKVSCYYGKIHEQTGSFLFDGKLNLKLMIRESLKSCSSPQQLAGKLSEYIATIDGERPELEQLTKIIWAVQKHLLRDLSSVHAKSPNEEYSKLDKLIVKTLLEITSKGGNLDPYALQREIVRRVQWFEGIKELTKRCQLTSTLSMVLADKLYHSSLITRFFSLKEKQHIETFILHQIELSIHNEILTTDEHRVELIQRLLALYALAVELPKNLSEETLRNSIREIMRVSQDQDYPFPEELDQVLFVFVNAEMHIMCENKSFDDHAALEDVLVEAYNAAVHLPDLTLCQKEQFELIVWKVIGEEGHRLDHIDPNTLRVIEKEVGNILLDNPHQSFRMILNSALQFFKSVLEVELSPQDLNEKIEVWAMQNDMLTRWIHFDQRTPLLALIMNLWNGSKFDECTVNHEEFIARALTLALKEFPLLEPYKEDLSLRLWILYKYFWYTALSDGSQSTYERFLLWHQRVVQRKHPHSSREKVNETLRKLSNQLVPLAPFDNVS